MIVANAGYEGAVVVEKVKANSNPNYGFNAETETFGDLVADGVIDPTKVTRAALQNAASIASLLLTTEASVSEFADKEAEAAAVSPGGMGGGMY
jgi:chaperonin GroEL